MDHPLTNVSPGFSSQLVFETFFVPILEALTASPIDITPGQLLTTGLIGQQFVSFFDRLATICTPHNLRRQVFFKHQSAVARLKTTNTCLWCLIQAPQRTLRCGHSLCEECLDQYYAPGHGVYTYVVDLCLVCGLGAGTLLKVKPPTVMPSLLGFDGGGVRGIVALVLTKRLQDALDVPYALWEFFHSVVGTSVGRVITTQVTLMQQLNKFRWSYCT